MISIYSISLGCPKNRVDTERALGALGPSRAADTPETADLVFINTCGFIAPAVEESVRVIVSTLHEAKGLDASRPAARSPRKAGGAGAEKAPARAPLVAVAGCLVGRYGERDLAAELPEVDLFLDNRDLESWPGRMLAALARRLPQRAARAAGDSGQAPAPGFGTSPAPVPGPALELSAPAAPPSPARLLSTGPAYAWLKISDGCRHACSFCTIPSIRGAMRSTPADFLAAEARALLEGGVKELIVVAQDITAWGSDSKPKRKLPDLLETLLPLPGLARLRLMYLYPAGLDKDLLGFLKDAGPPFVPYFDIPLQHAAPGVLSRMGRPFAQNPMAVVDRVRGHFPEAALRTSIITGFPGETQEDFARLCRFVEEARFHHLGVFAYQAEEGTPAATMPDQVPGALKEERRGELMALQKRISGEILAGYAGQRLSVLVDAPHEEWPGLHVGRTWFQAPESDGVTYISGPGAVPGALVDADIVESSDYDLTALV